MALPTNSPPTKEVEERAHRHGAGATRRFLRRIPQTHTHAASTLGGRRARSQAPNASRTTRTDIALAGLQLVIGYQWLVSGSDKILLGTFPAQVGYLLMGQITSGKLPAYFAVLLESLVVPNASVFGYGIMFGETLAGLGLTAAGLLMLLSPFVEAHISGRLWKSFAVIDGLVTCLAPIAAIGAGLLGLSYYVLDGAPTLWFTPSLAYGGAIAPGMVVALASLVLVVAQVFRLRASR